jgi:O-antigen/teichoic acid export membrane protein
MAMMQAGRPSGLRALVVSHLAESQHRNTYYLTLNNVTGAVAGFLFWFLFARVAGLPPSELGVGYAVVALGTTVAILAKGGLDTAIIRKAPCATREGSAHMLRFSVMLGASVAILLSLALWLVSRWAGPSLPLLGWVFVAAISALLVGTWLQDAHFVAEGEARFSFRRNLVLSASRLLLPLPIVALSFPSPVPLTWALGLVASALAAAAIGRRIPRRAGRPVPRREFLASAARNVTGSAAEYLPGLLLVPIVLAVDGPAAAAYFGVAWTAASVLFQTSAAISRSALAEMVRGGVPGHGSAVRRGLFQNLWLVAPAALAGIALAPEVLSLFGSAYAREGAMVFAILCASVLFVAPSYLYLAVLRARDRSLGLVLFPIAMVAGLLLLAPPLDARWGLKGVAVAWLLSNVPFGTYAAWRLRRESREVMTHGTPSVGGRPHPE